MSTSSTSFAATAGTVAMLVWRASPLLLIGLSVITALSGLLPVLNIIVVAALDFINVYFDFQHTFCVSIAFGSCVARNTFP